MINSQLLAYTVTPLLFIPQTYCLVPRPAWTNSQTGLGTRLYTTPEEEGVLALLLEILHGSLLNHDILLKRERPKCELNDNALEIDSFLMKVTSQEETKCS